MKAEKVIPFKDTGQISQELLYRMREKGKTYFQLIFHDFASLITVYLMSGHIYLSNKT